MCKNVWYCSVKHQRGHWKAHKLACRGGTGRPATAAVKAAAKAEAEEPHWADDAVLLATAGVEHDTDPATLPAGPVYDAFMRARAQVAQMGLEFDPAAAACGAAGGGHLRRGRTDGRATKAATRES